MKLIKLDKYQLFQVYKSALCTYVNVIELLLQTCANNNLNSNCTTFSAYAYIIIFKLGEILIMVI